MRAKLVPLIAILALLAAACSDEDSSTGVVTTEPVEDITPGSDTGEDSVERQTSTTASESSASDSSDLLTGFAGSWEPSDVEALELTDSNTIPVIDTALADSRVASDHWVWDWWPVRDRNGAVAEIDGWNVAIALSAPADVLPGKRHDIATHRYLLSNDGGRSWTDGGELFPADDEELLGSRQWAGSAMLDQDTGTLYAFYTAAGEEDEPAAVSTTPSTAAAVAGASTDSSTDTAAGASESDTDEPSAPSGGTVGDDISYRQRLAVATSTISATDGGVSFGDWSDHEVLLTGAETDLYATTQATAGGAGQIDAFRDPWFYLDPETGEEYILFTATMPQAECEGDGVVGVARASSDDLREWEVMPPMLDGHCVNNELERPHIVNEDDMTYLLFTTHSHTFRDGTSGPEGLYGFVADSFMGTYEPLNGSGLVLANPEEAPYQAYSWMTLPDGVATSFFQFFDIGGDVEISYIGEQSPEFQREHFGGTFAPSILIEFDGDETTIAEVLAPGQLVP